ncbi:immunity protein Imm33 domain-containing protein [Paenibacillus polymyxa]|uniref:immunity protein Imm33 domain-containing protein n=1 Tax=Paenibacillus polymyxa TaxID=1406 RepID=UPI003217811C
MVLREESVNEVDKGWRFFSDIDTDEFIYDPKNMTVYDFNTVVGFEPAVYR